MKKIIRRKKQKLEDSTRVNWYTCDRCRQFVQTVDIHEGTTPFKIPCQYDGCNGLMTSHFYRVPQILIEGVPTYEWYKPEKIRRSMGEATIEHIKRGGLILRKREESNE